MTRRQALTILLGVVISVFLLWVAGRNTDLQAIWTSIQHVRYWDVALLTVTMLIFYWVRAYRWKVLLQPIADVKTTELFGPVMIGYGANFLLPLQLGEVARSLAAVDRTGLPFMTIAFSIIVERLFDFLVILMALALSLAFHKTLPDFVSNLGIVVGIVVLILIALTVIFTLKTEAVLRRIKALIVFLPTRVQEQILKQLRFGAQGLQAVRHRRALIWAAAASVVQWSILVACIGISLHAVDLQVPAETLFLIVALMVLGGTIPNAPGYIGSIQAGFVVALEMTNADPAKGMAASIFYHSIYALTAVVLGLISLRRVKLDWKAVTAADNDRIS